MAADPFPILHLPSLALQKCLKQMSVAQLISISFLSKNTTEIIRMLEKEDINETITLTQSVSLNLSSKWLKIYDFISKPDQILQAAKICEHSVNSGPEELYVPGCTVKQLIDQVAYLFFQNEGILLQIVNLQSDYLKDVEEYSKNLNIEICFIDSTEIEEVPLLKFFSSVEKLRVSKIRISNSVHIQNFKKLNLPAMTLHKILCSNSSNIIVDDSLLSNKDLNLLMKHWMKGSNPRLRTMDFWGQYGPAIQTPIFEGIDVENLERDYRSNDTVCEIKRNDGTKAEIRFSPSLRRFRMKVTSFF
ncbi:F-box domain-containing protein [Caenorhabditis elegans]|uniref:F-box domain-containing protein n=1 Tax=Caenorhabditis elegans TaxID=6239 RepID=P91541_CAEEL|nr:F-box domain-containing protein [Caenorhabditis elegans]CCD63688.1 F-box domain-containing protein [Caenorhabditis elegans]|eukprot:NP_494026.1 F-box B protein [Caenorhabditis elegans]